MITTGELGDSTASVSVAAMPSMPGMLTSMSTTWGVSCRVTSIPVRPSAAVPTTSMSSSKESSFLRLSRVLAMSSMTTTRITGFPVTVLATAYPLLSARSSGTESEEILQHLRTPRIVAGGRRVAVRRRGPAVEDRLVGRQLVLGLDQRELILGQAGGIGQHLGLGGLDLGAVARELLEGAVVLAVLAVGTVVGGGGDGHRLLRRLHVFLDDRVDGTAGHAG